AGAARELHHRGRACVDVVGGGERAVRKDGCSELTVHARNGIRISLREVQNDVGHIPAFAARRTRQVLRRQLLQQTGELGVLLLERVEDGVVGHANSSYGVSRISCAAEMTT